MKAPRDTRWNNPILAAPKLAKETNEEDDIRVCLDVRFINDRIINVPDSNLLHLRDVIDGLGKFKWITL